MSQIEHTMFREYDLRGRENEQELNSRSALLIGKGYGTFLRRKGIKMTVLGHDNRRTSEEMHAAIRDGLISCGIHVIDIGLVTTPMMYWAQLFFNRQEKLDTRGGVMVTASHNPVGWNGVKLADDYASTLLSDDLQWIYRLIVDDDFDQGNGSFETRNIFDAYCDDLVSRVHISRPLTVVVNTGNGTAGAFAPTILRRAGCTVVEHLTELDPSYPHYTPNPAEVEMMEDTGRIVQKSHAQIGIAIDADGDRLGITDEKGEIIWPDRYMILLSRQILAQHPGAKIVFDVKTSNALPEDILAHGGKPIMWKTGHSYIKSKLREEQGALAGEMSGHVFYAEGYYGFDDAAFVALKLLEYLSKQDRPLSKIIAETPYYVSTPTYSAEVHDTNGQRADTYKYQIVDELTQHFRSQGDNVIDINGARVSFPDGSWGLVRASSNLPTLVMRFEAKSQERLEEIIQQFREQLDRFPGVSKEWHTA
ncbi:MAG TPA: phosphomannomutase/phosphoglucomutase [Ktedonobacteraceae bacterium]|nr:phosphomannomutase/phosphoglucomutase [Ktedonobacteraceae bacterium]